MARRFVLCRPQGGLNDVLCQIELCRRYANSHGRTLVVDTEGCIDSALPFPFDLLFVTESEDVHLRLTSELIAELNAAKGSVAPGKFGGRFHVRIPRATNTCRVPTGDGGATGADMRERVIVHLDAGGGNASHALLGGGHLRVAPSLLSTEMWHSVRAAHAKFSPYIAVHVRNTDLKTPDYRQRLDTIFADAAAKGDDGGPTGEANLSVLVCSDSGEVLQEAARLAARHGVRLLRPWAMCGRGMRHDTVAAGMVAAGKPVHLATKLMPRERAVTFAAETLRDLYLLSGASVLHTMAPAGRRGPAGFSRLATFLQRHPAVRAAVFGESEKMSE